MLVESYNGLTLNGGLGNYKTVITNGRLPYGLPAVSAQMLPTAGRWPRLAGIQRGEVGIQLDIYIRSEDGSRYGGSSSQLAIYFNPDDETSSTLTVTDADGTSNPRSVRAICIDLQEVPLSAGKHYVAILKVDGDPRWRKLASPVTWTLVGNGETNVLTNNGSDDAYPTRIQVFPTGSKTGGYAYRRWINVKWPMSDTAPNHPTDICNDGFNTTALVFLTKMQASGADLRVWVDGAEVDRWLDGMNTATTKVWCNIDWLPKQIVTLKTALAGAGAVDEIDVNETIADFPNAGILEIGSEIFIYTGKSNFEKRFTGCTRAQRGSSAAAHSVGDSVEWIQHDIYILYGNSSATAPSTDNTRKPIFNLATSTNGSWDFDEFGSSDPRSGQWAFRMFSALAVPYTANQNANAEPWSEIGIRSYNGDAMFSIGHPCLISNANFQNGEKYSANLSTPWSAGIWSSGPGAMTEDVAIAEPSTVTTWESWSANQPISNKKFVVLYLNTIGDTLQKHNLEVADVTLTIVNTPTITIGSETANYDLDCTIVNETTGESIRLTFPFLTTGTGAVEVNTDEYTVYEYENDRLIFSALTLVEGPRKNWLRLAPGNNTIRYNETGATNCVSLSWIWYERFYE